MANVSSNNSSNSTNNNNHDGQPQTNSTPSETTPSATALAAHNRQSGTTQDDAMVGYFFQRPQTDPDFQNYNHHSGSKRWALGGDDSTLETTRCPPGGPGGDGTSAELETDFQALALESDPTTAGLAASAKKIWGVTDHESGPHHQMSHGSKSIHHPPSSIHSSMVGHPPETSKSLLFADSSGWNTSTWSTGGGPVNAGPATSDHAVSDPLLVGRRSGSFPNEGPIMSPRSQEGLGVKMVEYVLGTSPVQKDLETRMANLRLGSDHDKKKGHHRHHKGVPEDPRDSNGIMDDEAKSMFNRAPGQGGSSGLPEEAMMMRGGPGGHHPSFESFDQHPFGMDPSSFNDYQSLMTPIDSPGIGMEGYNQMYHQGRNQSMMHGGQFGPQAGPGPGGQGPGFPPQNPYYQDPFAAQMGHMIPAGPPPLLPQYYGLPPWGMYPQMPGQTGPHMQQQAMMAAQRAAAAAASGRPMSPGASDGSSGPNGSGNGQHPMMAPQGHPYGPFPGTDQNGSMMMARAAAANAMNPMRMIPAHMMAMSNHQRMMMQGQNGPQGGQGPFPPSTTNGYGSGNGPNPQLSYPPNNNSGMNGGFGHMGHNGQGYNNNLGPIGGGLGSSGHGPGNSSPRRDSFDRRDSFSGGIGGFGTLDNNQFGRVGPFNGPGKNHFNQYGGPFGSASPGPLGMMGGQQSPPPMNGSLGRLSAAPGENKWMNGGGMRNGGHMSSGFNSIGGSLGNAGHMGVGNGGGSGGYGNRGMGGGGGHRHSSSDKGQPRSRLLEDFRNNRYPNLSLRDLTDHIVEFSQDQHGSRFIQQKLERATPPEKQMVFGEIISSAHNLMTDVFGNYVIQKFFEFGSPDQKQQLAMKVKGHVLPLALQMYGCRVIQKALESIPPDQQKEIVKELDGHVLKCVKDQNGNHVVQKCIECVDPHALQFIIDSFRGQVLLLSTHPYGCRVIQRILEHCTPEQTAPILEELHSQTEQLVQDQYGNYVIQHVLEHGRPEDKSKLINCVRGKVLSLSQHKFASNVVEKCVTHASRSERAMLIEEVCNFQEGTPHNALYTMMKDQYANYVIQKMIEVAEPTQRKMLISRIRPQVQSLRKYTYGKHILAKLEKYMMKNNDLGPIGAPPPSNGGL